MSECSVCFPEQRAIQINADISEGKFTKKEIAEKYNISYESLRRHVSNGHNSLSPSKGRLGASDSTTRVREELLAAVTSIKHDIPKVLKVGSDNLTNNGPIAHIFIPDTQVGPGTPIDHILWIAQYIVDHFYGKRIRIIIIGDWWDMPSLSSYDKGTKDYEGRRIIADFVAGNDAMAAFMKPLMDSRERDEKKGKTPWWPESLEFLDGNHEWRVERAIQLSPELEGLIGLDFMDVEKYGFNRYSFLKVANFEGVNYSHYFANPMTGRPYSGNNIETRLKNIGASFSMGHQQIHLTATRYVMGQQQRGLVSGACLTLNHKVLTADLRYIPIGELKVGDRIVSFDEEVTGHRSRRFKTGTVMALRPETRDVFEVTLDDGKVFTTTGDHQWLTRCGGQTSVKEGAAYQWRTTASLRKGTRVAKPLEEWTEDRTYEGGYLSGLLDGEGCYYKRTTTGGKVGQLTISQNTGPVLNKIRALLLSKYGADTTTNTANGRDCVSLRIKGGLVKIARVLGELRPIRLLSKFQPEDLGRITTVVKESPRVVSIRPAGKQTVMQIDVDAKTMIVEGYAHHNCYIHDEKYRGEQGNEAHWRGIVVCNDVKAGGYELMEVSLDYLCKRYEGKTLKQFVSKKYPNLQPF